MFSSIKNFFTTIYQKITTPLNALFNRATVDESLFVDLEKILLEADTGVVTTHTIITQLKKTAYQQSIATGPALKEAFKETLRTLLHQVEYKKNRGNIYLMVGINGGGKTTFCGKLAYQYAQQGKKVLMVAADTFRAAAVEQLQVWAEKSHVKIITGKEGQDPAAVVFNACTVFMQERYDIMIVDTAGRLQTKTNLMHELAKIGRVVNKQLAREQIQTLLVVDSMLGQNSFEQAKLFQQCTTVTGIVLTKMDGTSKGGIVFSIVDQLKIPVAYTSFGEKIDQIALFDSNHYVETLVP